LPDSFAVVHTTIAGLAAAAATAFTISTAAGDPLAGKLTLARQGRGG
jgi:hypothetical protein